MLKNAIKLFVMIALVLPLSFCTKIDEEATKEGMVPLEGIVALEALTDTASIPSKWGSLVSVSINPERELFYLCFEDEGGNLRLAVFDRRSRQLYGAAALITRK